MVQLARDDAAASKGIAHVHPCCAPHNLVYRLALSPSAQEAQCAAPGHRGCPWHANRSQRQRAIQDRTCSLPCERDLGPSFPLYVHWCGLCVLCRVAVVVSLSHLLLLSTLQCLLALPHAGERPSVALRALTHRLVCAAGCMFQ